ncbi:hypothetical protein Theam_1806 (plasmid) [Thermovibrio ammonificans HB-1]|uniref:Uncharacterized protein n=1 Tax=Thermovibrio ammonificans (strain DSM 15698 / JCM 12110 / HB-1) TaxID=648996 RepID=E8T6T9_THEA1|nr:hypothetical protein [Thermovibrio ammonificans]ADU97762.1 hypothetical protein Theam_1806 [Thermovibrio ammonificans HB-1]
MCTYFEVLAILVGAFAAFIYDHFKEQLTVQQGSKRLLRITPELFRRHPDMEREVERIISFHPEAREEALKNLAEIVIRRERRRVVVPYVLFLAYLLYLCIFKIT